MFRGSKPCCMPIQKELRRPAQLAEGLVGSPERGRAGDAPVAGHGDALQQAPGSGPVGRHAEEQHGQLGLAGEAAEAVVALPAGVVAAGQAAPGAVILQEAMYGLLHGFQPLWVFQQQAARPQAAQAVQQGVGEGRIAAAEAPGAEAAGLCSSGQQLVQGLPGEWRDSRIVQQVLRVEQGAHYPGEVGGLSPGLIVLQQPLGGPGGGLREGRIVKSPGSGRESEQHHAGIEDGGRPRLARASGQGAVRVLQAADPAGGGLSLFGQAKMGEQLIIAQQGGDEVAAHLGIGRPPAGLPEGQQPAVGRKAPAAGRLVGVQQPAQHAAGDGQPVHDSLVERALGLAVEDGQHHLAYGAQGVLVDDVQVVVVGVPVVAKAGLGIHGPVYDVDHGNAGDGVHKIVVVQDAGGGLIHEVVAVAHGLGQLPDFIHHLRGEAHREALLGEAGALGAHHIQQDAVLGIVARYMRIARPVLGAQPPAFVVLAPGFAVVLRIEEDDVYPNIRRVLPEEAGHLQQYGHAAGAVVGPEYGLVLAAFLILQGGVGKGPGIPVGGQEDALAGIGIEPADDVGGLQAGAVVGRGLEVLLHHLGAVGFQLAHQPGPGVSMPLGIGHARTECQLPGYKGKGRILVEARNGCRRAGGGLGPGFGSRRGSPGRIGTAAAEKQEQRKGQAGKEACHSDGFEQRADQEAKG